MDLRWWLDALERKPERSIQKRAREVISIWTDAASTRGLGGYYIDERKTGSVVNNTWTTVHTPHKPHPGAAFSISLLRHLSRKREHINTKEMHAVEQALLYWGSRWW